MSETRIEGADIKARYIVRQWLVELVGERIANLAPEHELDALATLLDARRQREEHQPEDNSIDATGHRFANALAAKNASQLTRNERKTYQRVVAQLDRLANQDVVDQDVVDHSQEVIAMLRNREAVVVFRALGLI